MERSKAGTKSEVHDGLSVQNQNSIIINITWYYFMIWKKYNEIQLTKNTANSNNRKITHLSFRNEIIDDSRVLVCSLHGLSHTHLHTINPSALA